MAKLMCPLCGATTSFSPAQIIGKGVLLGKSSDKYTEWGDVQLSAVTPFGYDFRRPRLRRLGLPSLRAILRR